jgi:hypothetical protein
MVVSLIALFVAAAGTAYATGENQPLLGGARNPGADTSTALTRETQIIASLSGYGTRQSNKSASGGGAIYGCRSGAGGTPAGNKPCIRSNNLSSGLAFEFATTGANGGTITATSTSASPFTTNATGVATGLNADQVDGKSASEFLGATATAASAQNANGVVPAKIFYNQAQNTAAATIYSGNGLTLTAECGSAGALTLQVSSAKSASLKYHYFHVNATHWADGDGVSTGNGDAGEDDTFVASDAPRTLTGWNDSESGSISYVATDGSTVEISLSAEEDAFGVTNGCLVSGMALGA